MSDPDIIAAVLLDALDGHEDTAPRTRQARDGILGPSDIGFCRQKAVLVTRQVAPTDKVPRWSASVGTAIHNYVEAAIKKHRPGWLCGSVDGLRVTATLPSGAQISGHPDLVIPEWNAVIDIKTVDGFEWVRRNSTSLSHQYQRHLYAMGLTQAGILDPDKPVYVGNAYFDRSGKQPEPLIKVEEFDPSLTFEIDNWVTDVIYAVKHGQDASRDVAPAVCERICDFFTVCRGGLDVGDGQEIIADADLLAAIDMYVEGRDAEKRGKQMKNEASVRLAGVNGITSDWQVRWVEVGGSSIRLDVRKVRRG